MKTFLLTLSLLLLMVTAPLAQEPAGIAFEALTARAAAGDTEAMFLAGQAYFQGQDTAQDYVEAREWFAKLLWLGGGYFVATTS